MTKEMNEQAMAILREKVFENLDKIAIYVGRIIRATGDENIFRDYRLMVMACGDFKTEELEPTDENLKKVVRLLNNTEGKLSMI